jgi:hypothetical protein
MAAAVMKWWQQIHNGGSPTVVSSGVPANALLESTTLAALVETTSGDYLVES